MRLSQLFLPTERQPPADAEALSHKLMVRAGLVRQLGAGLWTWLPAGWRVHQRVVQIVREEIDAIGGQEMLMPVLQPARAVEAHRPLRAIDELFKLQDRKGADMVLAMTHEEAVTFHVAQVVRSYRDLPLMPLPLPDQGARRAAPARRRPAHARVHHEGLLLLRPRRGGPRRPPTSATARPTTAIFERCGLDCYECESDVGMMGGTGAHEFMAPCAGGRERRRRWRPATPPTSRSPAPTRSPCRRCPTLELGRAPHARA